jgi:arylsulfatase A-like enzyme
MAQKSLTKLNAWPLHLLCMLLVFALASPGWAAQTAALKDRRPNIVFILADDMGYGDLGCYGRRDIQTPNIDRLAEEGVRFTEHYANGPECTPTRAAFLTGRYAQWVGGLECAIGTGNVGRYDDAIRLANQRDLGLPVDHLTIAGLLKQAGYATAITGKWHLGYESKFAPHLHGFDYSFYCIGGGMDYFHYLDTEAGYNLFQQGNPIRREGYFTDLATDEAIAFIKRQSPERSFFLYLPYTCPHSPFQGPDEKTPNPLPLDSPRWRQGNAPPEVYIAMIEHMDRRIGDLLHILDQLNLAKDTVVVFAGDNGGTGSSRNAPLSGIKGSTFEGGIRVPGIVRWPGRIPAGIVSSQACITFDFTMSMARLAGVQASPVSHFEGMDIIRHVALDKENLERTLFWRKPRGSTLWKGARHGYMKYVSQKKGDTVKEYLFDLSKDIAEKNNLKDEYPSKFLELKGLYDVWEETTRRNRRGRP